MTSTVPTGDRPGHTIHDRMRHWAESDPYRVAIRFVDNEISYASLSRRSTAAASVLRAARPRVVAVLMADSPALISTLFGVLASGNAFLCPGVSCPPDRLRTILRESGCTTVIVDQSAAVDLPDSVTELFRCTSSGQLTAEQPIRATTPGQVSADAVAYVVYTSGSTGTPKGVVHTHRGFGSFLDWQPSVYDLRPGRVVAQWSVTTFDASYAEIFGTLCHGATLWMTSRTIRQDPHTLLGAMEDAAVHVLQVVPSFLQQMLTEIETNPGTGRLPALTHLMSTGEALTPSLAARCRSLLPHARLVNLYGPTETVLATSHVVDDTDLTEREIPLGQPIDGCELLVLDEGLRSAPHGTVGEIYLKTDTLALGYLHQPALTAAAFVPAPGHTSARMYRTGDLAWRTPEGRLHFAGRKDDQLKIRGMRLELGEIEAAIEDHPAVRDCAVRARGEGPSTRLEAHVVASGPVTPDDLRHHLAQRLPQYMVPALVRFTDSLPLTRTGKKDRSALPEIAPDRGSDAVPANGTELRVAVLWEEVLRVTGVTADDDFFALGGQSVDAMRLTNRVRLDFGVDLPVTAIFDAPTVAEYATAVHAADQGKGSPDAL